MKTIDAEFIGEMTAELLEGHADSCERADIPSLLGEGYEIDDIAEVDFVAGDKTRIRMITKSGREFRIEVSEKAA